MKSLLKSNFSNYITDSGFGRKQPSFDFYPRHPTVVYTDENIVAFEDYLYKVNVGYNDTGGEQELISS